MITEEQFLATTTTIITEPLSLTMGVFDGLHCGHQALFKQTIQLATERGYKSAIVSFDFSRVDLKKRDHYLLSAQETEQSLANELFDYHIIIQFGTALQALTPQAYMEQFTSLFNIKAITVGTDFYFGHNRTGDVDVLAAYGLKFGYQVYPIALLEQAERRISSRTIEALLLAGDVEQANVLLGYTYAMCGHVIHGEQKGRQLGFPTANMTLPTGKVVLPNGVYVSRVQIGDKLYDAVTNIGTSPTIKSEERAIVETHIFDFVADIYGQELIVYFYYRIRDELKFSSVDALIAQMKNDSAASRDYLEHH